MPSVAQKCWCHIAGLLAPGAGSVAQVGARESLFRADSLVLQKSTSKQACAFDIDTFLCLNPHLGILPSAVSTALQRVQRCLTSSNGPFYFNKTLTFFLQAGRPCHKTPAAFNIHFDWGEMKGRSLSNGGATWLKCPFYKCVLLSINVSI